MRAYSFVFAGVLAAMAACQTEEPAPGAPRAQKPEGSPPQPTLTLVGHRDRPVVRAADETEVRLRVEWTNAVAGDRQIVDILDPSGGRYRRFETTLGANTSPELSLPILGTEIADLGMYGTWKARVYRNSTRVALFETTFEIQP